MSSPFILIDGSSYLLRAFHALPALVNSHGEPTGAIFGVINMLRKLIAEYQPAQIAVVFDTPAPTFRDQLYPAYKANRPNLPAELITQIQSLHDVIRAMGLPLILINGVEADDVIATLATQAAAQALITIIVSSDKDFTQLVNERITLLDTMKNQRIDRAAVLAKFGVPPERMVDYLTLTGDSTDNIPGVAGIGPKSAVKLLNEYGSLDNLIANAALIKGKVGDNLRATIPQLELIRQLVTVQREVALPVSLADLFRTPPNHSVLKDWFLRLEFRSWLDELLTAADNANQQNKINRDYATLLTEAALNEWITRLQAAPIFAIDTETTSFDYMQAQIVGISFAVAPGIAAYLPLAHTAFSLTPQLTQTTHVEPVAAEVMQIDRDQALARLKPLLENPNYHKVGHNLKYDLNILANHGINLAGIKHDSMLESYVLDSTATQHDLDSLALKFLGERTIHYEEVAGKGANQISFDQVPIERAAVYAAEDADMSLRLHQYFEERFNAVASARNIYETLEMPLLPVLARMERHGVLIDSAALRLQSHELAAQLLALEKQCHRLAGEVFNLASPNQIQTILFERMGLPILERTPSKKPSTAEAVLEQLAIDHELPRLILAHRSLAKLLSTYTERLPEQVNSVTGRIHTHFHQAVAATGRLSSSQPNLQNIPIRTPEGRRIRAAFIAPPGYRLLSADYSQIELRIMAHLSGDSGLVTAFKHNEDDIHRATAAEVFNIPLAAVTDEQRRSAKAINFGLIYGMSAFGLARQLGVDRITAQSYIDLYFARYHGVKIFMDEIREKARQQGFVETLLGRRLYLPEINSRNRQRREYAERSAINAPMQGTAADIIKLAMLQLDNWLRSSGVNAHLVLQVHDELVIEVIESQAAMVATYVKDIMINAVQLAVPLAVNITLGNNWE